MSSRSERVVGGAGLALACACALVACWDSASLDVSTGALSESDAGPDVDASVDASFDAPLQDCPAPFVVCGPVCTDTNADPFNCGGCGVSCAAPKPPACEGTVATLYGPGMCVAGTCDFPKQTADCAALNRVCASGDCVACLAGFQDNDLNGTCTPDCGTAALTCSGNGACSDASGTAQCICDPGFSGPACATNIDDCAGTPCQNGGQCIDGVGSFTCNCLPGFSGTLCATNIDDCAGAPCQNGGQCIDGVNSYTCNCVGGFTGPNCQTLNPTFLWLDATDPSTITKDGTDLVSEWRDKSGLARHATVPAGSVAPIWTPGIVNALPAIQFDGATVRLQTGAVPTSAEMTIFVVFNMVNPMTWGSLINQDHDTYFSIRKSDCCGGGGNLNFHIENDNAAPLQPITLNTWKVVTAVRAGTTSTLYYEPGTATSFTGDTLTGGVNVPVTVGNAMALAKQESMGGFIAEVRAFDTALDATARAGVELELKTKYAIP